MTPTTVIKMPSVPVNIPVMINRDDFTDLLNCAVPFEDGQMWHREKGMTKMLIGPNRVKLANRILKRYGLPLLEVVKVPKMEGEVDTDTKEKTKLRIYLKMEEETVVVVHNKVTHNVPFHAVDAVYEVIKAKERVFPRSVWYDVAMKENLFPETFEIIQALNRDTQLAKERISALVAYMHSLISSQFEGSRRAKKDGWIFSRYWYPVLVLKKLELIDQVKPNRELFLLREGNWRDEAERMFERIGVEE